MDKMAEVSFSLSKKMDVSVAAFSLIWEELGDAWAEAGWHSWQQQQQQSMNTWPRAWNMTTRQLLSHATDTKLSSNSAIPQPDVSTDLTQTQQQHWGHWRLEEQQEVMKQRQHGRCVFGNGGARVGQGDVADVLRQDAHPINHS